MDLETLLHRHTLISRLQASDESEIFELFERAPMRAEGLELIYDRSPSFNALLRCQNEWAHTFVARAEGHLCGFGSLSWGRRWIDGAPQWVGYLGDLRIGANRQLTRRWRRFYGDLLDVVTSDAEFGPCRRLFTAVLRQNHLAVRALTRGGRQAFRYEPLREMEMVNLFFAKPWSRADVGPFRAEPSQTQLKDVQKWMAERHRQMHFGADLGAAPESEWNRRLKFWPGLNTDDLITVRDSGGHLALAVWPWAPTPVKRMRIQSAAFTQRALYAWLRLMGLNGPRVGADLRVLYLTHLTFAPLLTPVERAQALMAALRELRHRAVFRDYHVVSFADQSGLAQDPRLKAFVRQSVGVNLYSVIRAHESAVPLAADREIDFEMAVV